MASLLQGWDGVGMESGMTLRVGSPHASGISIAVDLLAIIFIFIFLRNSSSFDAKSEL